jgi:hypothetical protein
VENLRPDLSCSRLPVSSRGVGGSCSCFLAMGVDREEELQGSEGGIDVLMRRDVDLSDFFGEDKENLCVFVDYAAESLQQRSPLPVGYPRSPLQDITDVLSSMNVCSISAHVLYF